MKAVILGAKNPETERMILAIERLRVDWFVGFIDNDPLLRGTEFCGLPVLGGFELLGGLVSSGHAFVNTISGSTRVRKETTDTILAHGGSMLNFIHPSVDLYGVAVGQGVYIQDGCIIQAGVSIGDNACLHMGNLIAHQVHIGPSAFVSFGCHIAGEVEIGEGVFVGAGATIIPRVKVGDWATIGAGAVVIRDVAAGETVVGSPARKIKEGERA